MSLIWHANKIEQIHRACAAGIPRGAVLMDTSYGTDPALRSGIAALELSCVAAIGPAIKVRAISDEMKRRLSVKNLALSLPKHENHGRDAMLSAHALGAGSA